MKAEKDVQPIRNQQQLDDMKNKDAEYAGVEHVSNHTLRKTFGYWFYKASKDITMLQRILHHSYPALYRHY